MKNKTRNRYSLYLVGEIFDPSLIFANSLLIFIAFFLFGFQFALHVPNLIRLHNLNKIDDVAKKTMLKVYIVLPK